MIKRNILLLALGGLLLGACSEEGQYAEPAPKEIRLEFGFGDNPWTRVTTDQNFNSWWEDGDQVGLYVVKGNAGLLQPSGNLYDNVQVRFDGLGWSTNAAMFYPNDGETVYLYAYYPYDPNITDITSHIFNVRADQSAAGDYSKSDFLTAKAQAVKGSTGVVLNFSHALSMIQVEAVRDPGIPAFDESLSLTLKNVPTGAKINWQNPMTGTGATANITMYKVAGLTHTYRALVPSGTLPSTATVSFRQTTPGKEIDMEWYGISSKQLIAGQTHKYKVTVANP